jgi:multiple sugar transport system ATP-binding protein
VGRIVFENVSKVFGDSIAIEGLSFECGEGEFFGILGPSGAGKTTILNLIAGLDEATSGRIWIGEKLVNGVEPRFRDVAYAFENYYLYPHLSVYQNIAFPLGSPIRKREKTDEQIRSAVQEIATTLQINHLLERQITQLSGGQRQRVALARTLIRSPRAYLLDEAIAHLDAKLRHSIRSVLKGYQRSKGITTVYATPDQLDAIAMCDRLMIIRNGRVEQIGDADDAYRFPANEFVATYVGYPQMNILQGKLIDHDGRLTFSAGESAIELKGAVKEAVQKVAGSGEIDVGVRPHDIKLRQSPSRDGLNLQADIRMVEHYGDFRVVHFRARGSDIRVKSDDPAVEQPGQTLFLSVALEKLFVFDARNGQSIWPNRSVAKN